MKAQVWTDDMDRVLLDGKARPGATWKAIAPINGMNATACQRRYEWLMSEGGRGAVAQTRERLRADAETDALTRDGLDWLLKKNRLTARRHAAAMFYRKAFRDGGGLSLKSSLGALDDVRGAPGPGTHADAGAIAYTQAMRDLHVVRTQVLWSQDDLLTVLDGVCGVGHTPRDLVGGDGWKAKAIEAVLMVALDLVARWLDTRARAHG